MTRSSEGNTPSYLVVILPTPPDAVQRMLDSLEVPEDVFLLDVVRYAMSQVDTNPFIDTLMEIPSHMFDEGVPVGEQIESMRGVLETWFEHSGFEELKTTLSALMEDYVFRGKWMSPRDVRFKDNLVAVEFIVTTEEDRV